MLLLPLIQEELQTYPKLYHTFSYLQYTKLERNKQYSLLKLKSLVLLTQTQQ